MTFRHGKHASVEIAGNDLSQYCDNESLTIDVDTAETSTFGDDWKQFLAGMAGGNLSLGGNYDPTATTGPVVVLTGLIGGGPVAVVVYPGGNTSGQISHTFNALLTNYSETAAASDKVTFSASLLATGAVTTAIV